jgi:hypothetical protein
MNLHPIRLHKLLKENGVNFLHHANSVATSITYIENKGLLSRGAVKNLGLYQTGQTSDKIDKQFDVWDDIFLDTQDLHHHFLRQNSYGPVLFKFSIDFLLKTKYEIRVTKNNPIHWSARDLNKKRYFSSVRELRETWGNYKTHRKMVTIRKNTKPILFKYLREIVLDEPGLLLDGVDLFQIAKKALTKALRNVDVDLKVQTRKCPSACWCKNNYFKQVSERDLKRLFDPQYE